MGPRLQRVLRFLGRLAFVLTWLWCIGAIWFSDLGPRWLTIPVAIAFGLAWPVLWHARREDRRRIAQAFVCVFVLLVIAWQFKQPSNDRDWTVDMVKPARITIDGNTITIQDMRDNRYRSVADFDVRHVDHTFDLRSLRTVDFLVERFHTYEFLAHTLLTFGFEDGRHVAISVELRRENGEGFDPIAGIYKQFELMYVVATEQDVIGLRTNHRASNVWLFPIKTDPERAQRLFVAMLSRARSIAEEPEFYNTLTSSCTTNIADHVRSLVPGRVPLDWRILFPGYSGELAHELDLIDTDLSFPDAAERFQIDAVAQASAVGDDFSARIRSQR